MGLVYSEGFDKYSTTNDLVNSANWSSISGNWTWNATAGRKGGGALVAAPGSGAATTINNLFNFTSTIYCGICFWLKCTAAPAANTLVVTNQGQNGIGIGTTGLILLYGFDGTVRNTGTINVADGAWHWCEWKTNHQNGIAMSYWCDGINMNNVNTGTSGTTASVTVNALATNGTLTIDDLMVIDDVAPVPRATTSMPLNAQVITTSSPQADGSVQFTPNSGANNYSRVNETVFDDDTSYVESGTSGNADTYDFAALGFTPSAVTSVQLLTRVKNPGAGQLNFKNRCISAGTTGDGASTVAPNSYRPMRTIYNQDPKTVAAWTGANLDAATFGFTVV